jgi:hypothetical protein
MRLLSSLIDSVLMFRSHNRDSASERVIFSIRKLVKSAQLYPLPYLKHGFGCPYPYNSSILKFEFVSQAHNPNKTVA